MRIILPQVTSCANSTAKDRIDIYGAVSRLIGQTLTILTKPIDLAIASLPRQIIEADFARQMLQRGNGKKHVSRTKKDQRSRSAFCINPANYGPL